MRSVGIIGAGAWGTALAMLAHWADRRVLIQAHEPEVAAAINAEHRNPAFLPDVVLPAAIRACVRPQEAAQADVVLLAVPAQYLRTTITAVAPAWPAGTPAVVCAKGIERETGALMSEIVAEALPDAPVAVLSGPSFAGEVARRLPTAVTVASADAAAQHAVAAALGVSHFRIYTTDDVVGAEIGGAVKNVLAIACGIVHGRRFGDNARAALITRGLAEMTRFAAAKGGRPETLMGLSGLGDLVLTCTAMQSRNFSLGDALGRGGRLEEVLGGRRAVTEGVSTAASVSALARRLDVEMPICFAVDAVVNHGADIDTTIAGLLARPLREEAPPARPEP